MPKKGKSEKKTEQPKPASPTTAQNPQSTTEQRKM